MKKIQFLLVIIGRYEYTMLLLITNDLVDLKTARWEVPTLPYKEFILFILSNIKDDLRLNLNCHFSAIYDASCILGTA